MFKLRTINDLSNFNQSNKPIEELIAKIKELCQKDNGVSFLTCEIGSRVYDKYDPKTRTIIGYIQKSIDLDSIIFSINDKYYKYKILEIVRMLKNIKNELEKLNSDNNIAIHINRGTIQKILIINKNK